jgi:hypothetical protein
VKQNLRAIPNNKIDLMKMKKKRFMRKMVRKPSREMTPDEIKFAINEEETFDKKHFYQTLEKRLSYARKGGARSGTLGFKI